MEEGSSRQGKIRPPEEAGTPRETKPREPHQRQDPGEGRTDEGGGGGSKTQPPNRPTQEQEPDGGEGAAPRGATESLGRGDSADAGYSPAQTPDAAQAAAEGAQGRARPAPAADTGRRTDGGDDTPRSTGTSRGGGDNDDAGHSPAQTPVAAQAASERAQGSARPVPSPGQLRQKAGGDNNLRREGETG